MMPLITIVQTWSRWYQCSYQNSPYSNDNAVDSLCHGFKYKLSLSCNIHADLNEYHAYVLAEAGIFVWTSDEKDRNEPEIKLMTRNHVEGTGRRALTRSPRLTLDVLCFQPLV